MTIPASKQGQLFRPVHRSRQQRRLKYKHQKGNGYVNAERIYAAEWLRLNKPSGTYPRGLLELILRVDGGPIPTVSQRDAEIAAAVVQWLGTNVGAGFIETCERKIDAARDRVSPPTVSPALATRPTFEVNRRIDLD